MLSLHACHPLACFLYARFAWIMAFAGVCLVLSLHARLFVGDSQHSLL